MKLKEDDKERAYILNPDLPDVTACKRNEKRICRRKTAIWYFTCFGFTKTKTPDVLSHRGF
ncbi:hypothetical protein BVG80_00725 [Sphingobacteriales bacterium TSM_CSM]|nr:hypothetical protein BVG80_00725 [Sphingobacteriales bacterium TSM_CSM]